MEVYKEIKQQGFFYWLQIGVVFLSSTALMNFIYYKLFTSFKTYQPWRIRDVILEDLGPVIGIIVGLVVLFLITSIHEIIHGIQLKLKEKSWSFRIAFRFPISVYCPIPSGLNKRVLLPVLLAPFWVYSIVFFVLSLIFPYYSEYFVLLATIHIFGCCGDFYNSILIVKHWRHFNTIEDSKDGFKLIR